MLSSWAAEQVPHRSQHTRKQQGTSTSRMLTVPCESIIERHLLLKALTGHLMLSIQFCTAFAQKAVCCKDMQLVTHCIKLACLTCTTDAAAGLASLTKTGLTVELRGGSLWIGVILHRRTADTERTYILLSILSLSVSMIMIVYKY